MNLQRNSTFWPSLTLGEICLKITDGTHKTPMYQESGVPFFSAKNIKLARFDTADHRWISLEEHLQLFSRCNPEPGDVMLSKSGSLGTAAVVPDLGYEFSLFESVALLKPDRDKIDGEYLCQFLNSPSVKMHYEEITSGLAVQHLHLVDVRKIKLKLPPLRDQLRIAALLRTWDQSIESNSFLLSAKRKAFGGKRSKIFSQIAAQSEMLHLAEVLSLAPKQQPETIVGKKLLTVKLHCQGIEANESQIPIETANGRPYYVRSAGELIIGRQNFHNGGIGIVPKELNDYLASNAISSFLVKENLLNVEYICHFLSRPEFYEPVEALMGGTGQKELSETEFLKLTVPVPTLSMQLKISNYLNCLKDEIIILERQNAALAKQKSSLMQKLLTGEWHLDGRFDVVPPATEDGRAA
jgi:type I restriction enzyme, S subunit